MIIKSLNNKLHSSSYFQVFQFLYQSFGDCTRSTDNNWYNHHFHIPQFFQFSSKVLVLILLFTFFQFYSVVTWDSKVDNFASSPFCWLLQGLVVWLRLGDPFVSQNPREVMVAVIANRQVQILDKAGIQLGKAWIQLFFHQLLANSRADCFLLLWLDNWSRRRKTLNSNQLNFN